jgi:ribosomal protein S13
MTQIRKSSYSINARRSSISGFKSLYGIGKLKAIKLNCFLLNHPIQAKFSTNFRAVMKEVRQRDLLHLIPVDKKVRLYVENHMQNKILTYCYQAYRLFQNLPTRGQRTKANANAIVNQNPYLALRINISFYHNLQVAYKKIIKA